MKWKSKSWKGCCCRWMKFSIQHPHRHSKFGLISLAIEKCVNGQKFEFRIWVRGSFRLSFANQVVRPIEANNKIKTSAIWFTLVGPRNFRWHFLFVLFFLGSAGKLKSEIWASSCRAVWRAIKSNYIWICHKLKAESRKPHRSPSHSIAGFIKVSFVAVDARRFQHQHHHSAHDFWFWKRSDLQNIPMLRIRSVDHVLLLILVAVALVAGKQESACEYAKKIVIKFIVNYKWITHQFSLMFFFTCLLKTYIT